MPYAYTNTLGAIYYLHRRSTALRNSTVERPIFYFRRELDQAHAIDAVPDGYEIVEGPRGALPMLRKRRM